jgi:hypothetical protein
MRWRPVEAVRKLCMGPFVGRPGLDPGTLGLKGTFHRLLCVGLVAHVFCFQENVLF